MNLKLFVYEGGVFWGFFNISDILDVSLNAYCYFLHAVRGQISLIQWQNNTVCNKMFIFHSKPGKEKFVLVNCRSFWGWRNKGTYITDILHILVQAPVEEFCRKMMKFLLLPSLVLILKLNLGFCPFGSIF